MKRNIIIISIILAILMTIPVFASNINKGETGNKNFKAGWDLNQYKITYDLDGGVLPSGKTNPDTYSVETKDFTLNNPEKDGFTFTGWTGSNGSVAQTDITISKGAVGDKEYKANWESTTHKLTLMGNGATIDNENKKVIYAKEGDKITLPEAFNECEMFMGYSEDPNEKYWKVQYKTDYTMPSKDTVLYAKTEPLKVYFDYFVYDIEKGEGSSSSRECGFDSMKVNYIDNTGSSRTRTFIYGETYPLTYYSDYIKPGTKIEIKYTGDSLYTNDKNEKLYHKYFNSPYNLRPEDYPYFYCPGFNVKVPGYSDYKTITSPLLLFNNVGEIRAEGCWGYTDVYNWFEIEKYDVLNFSAYDEAKRDYSIKSTKVVKRGEKVGTIPVPDDYQGKPPKSDEEYKWTFDKWTTYIQDGNRSVKTQITENTIINPKATKDSRGSGARVEVSAEYIKESIIGYIDVDYDGVKENKKIVLTESNTSGRNAIDTSDILTSLGRKGKEYFAGYSCSKKIFSENAGEVVKRFGYIPGWQLKELCQDEPDKTLHFKAWWGTQIVFDDPPKSNRTPENNRTVIEWIDPAGNKRLEQFVDVTVLCVKSGTRVKFISPYGKEAQWTIKIHPSTTRTTNSTGIGDPWKTGVESISFVADIRNSTTFNYYNMIHNNNPETKNSWIELEAGNYTFE